MEKDNMKKDKKVLIIAICILMLLVISIIVVMNIKEKKVAFSEKYSINKISELATLKCYYHDVAEYKSDAKGLFNIGYKKYWVEYSGIVKLGIEAKEIEVNEPDENGIIKVYIPDAKVLETEVDKESIQEPITEEGMFTTIKLEEKIEAYTNTQKTMEENAKKDGDMLLKAKDNAKAIIANYLIGLGKQLGQEYTVQFIDKPLNNK